MKILIFHIFFLKIVSFLHKIWDFSRKKLLLFLMLDMQLFGDTKKYFCFKIPKNHWKSQQNIFLHLYSTYKCRFVTLKLRHISHNKLSARSNSGTLFNKHFYILSDTRMLRNDYFHAFFKTVVCISFSKTGFSLWQVKGN